MPSIVLHPYDATAQINQAEQELHVITANGKNLIIPNCGAFFKDTLLIKARLRPDGVFFNLIENTHYTVGDFNETLSALTGKAVYESLVITKDASFDIVRLDYYFVGGENYINSKELLDSFDAHANTNFTASFNEIAAKPVSGYLPSEHHHDIREYYNLGKVVEQLNFIADAIYEGDNKIHDYIYSQIDQKIQNTTQELNDYLDITQSANLALIQTRLTQTTNRLTVVSNKLSVINSYLTSAENNRQAFNTIYNNHLKYIDENIYCASLKVLDDYFLKSTNKNYNIFEHITGLHAWLDFTDTSKCKIEQGILTINDKAVQRTFSGNAMGASIYNEGKMNKQSLQVNAAANLNLTLGAPIRIKQNSTILVIFSAPEDSAGYNLFKSNTGYFKLRDSDSRAITIGSTDSVYLKTLEHSCSARGISGTILTIAHNNLLESKLHSSSTLYLRTNPLNIDLSSYSPQAIDFSFNTLFDINATSLDKIKLYHVVIFDRQLKRYEIEALNNWIRNRFELTINSISNASFNFDRIAFNFGYLFDEALSTNKSYNVTANSYSDVFADNLLRQPLDENVFNQVKKLAIKGGSLTDYLWEFLAPTDRSARHTLEFDVLYGQNNTPIFTVTQNTNEILSSFIVDQNRSFQRIKVSFLANADQTSLKIFNKNTDTNGNTFFIGNFKLYRDMSI